MELLSSKLVTYQTIFLNLGPNKRPFIKRMYFCFQKYLIKNAYSADWRFNPELVSNQSPKEMVLMAVREKLLEHLKMNLPYQMELFLSEWEVDEKGTLRLTVQLKCPKKGAMVSCFINYHQSASINNNVFV